MIRLNNAGADSALGDVAGAGCGEVDYVGVDSAGVDNTGASNNTRNTNTIKVDIVTIESKIPILVSLKLNVHAIY